MDNTNFYDKPAVAGNECNLTISDIKFSKSINGASDLISISDEGKVAFSVGSGKDYFSDPDGKLTSNTSPILLTEIDNSEPFTFTAKVSPTFSDNDIFNACVLFIYANESLYQKHCFEQVEHGRKKIVTVRTDGYSDDSHHEIIDQEYAYLKISSDSKTVGCYYSLDNKEWQMVRLYKNEYPEQIWIGISAQCPTGKGTVHFFDKLELSISSVSDFRNGI